MNHLQTNAMVRDIAHTYVELYRQAGITVFPELMESQHAAYVSALRASGLSLHRVAAANDYPDCVFIEDVAVVFGARALIGRIAPHREGEQGEVADALAEWHEIIRLPPGAKLEGGDVMHIGETTYVGLSERTNEAGIEALRDFLHPARQRVVEVRVEKALHLKTAATYLGDGTLVAARDLLDTSPFEVADIIFTERDERGAANCLRILDHLLISTGRPATAKRLRTFAERNGVNLIALDNSEFEKGNGSLTCLSLIW
ncbi:MAG: N(G),N(G)-dimethylarginine dimethylaminohydrolase [Acidobacteria bacterium]|nr:N(G),N(G)-dimethylarginine dimethylaminohydrolase [Acidobacteriota bacterium]